jgi:methionine biosynthesis protein MetW
MAEGEHLYDTDVDLRDLRFTYGKIASRIPRGSLVLDVGCAAGKFAQALKQDLACEVLGIDNNAEALGLAKARGIDVISADLTAETLPSVVGDAQFDIIVFADVLEHMLSPEPLLLGARDVLKPGGKVLVSFPNIAHIDIGVMLAQGDWRYRTSGLLDDTHLRFYTLSSFSEVTFSCGYDIVSIQQVRLPSLATEVLDFGGEVRVEPKRLAELQGAIRRVNSDPEVYQYVLELAVAPERMATSDTKDVSPAAALNVGEEALPTVTVLVRSAPGREAILATSLESMTRQNYPVIDVVIAAIGADSAAAAAMRSKLGDNLTSLVSRVVAVANGEGSLSTAINVGIELADTDYLTVIDDDDLLADEWLSQMTRCLAGRPWLSVAYSRWKCVVGNVTEGGFQPAQDLGERGSSQSHIEMFLGHPIPISACLLKVLDIRLAGIRADVAAVGNGDWLFLRAMMSGHEFQFVPGELVECRLHSERLGPSPEDRTPLENDRIAELSAGHSVQSIRLRANDLIDVVWHQRQLEAELEATQVELSQARQALGAVLLSRSWRMTRLLRRITRSELPNT